MNGLKQEFYWVFLYKLFVLKTYFLFLLMILSACSSSKKSTEAKYVDTELTAATLKVPGITIEQLKLGNKIYTRDCSGCHRLHKPSEYTTEQWHPILARMFVKSKISDSTTKILISNYVIAKSK